jgi:hypothetical protein
MASSQEYQKNVIDNALEAWWCFNKRGAIQKLVANAIVSAYLFYP